MLPSPVLHLGNRTVKPLIMLCWELNEVLKLRVCSKLVVGGGAHYLLNCASGQSVSCRGPRGPQLQGLTAPSSRWSLSEPLCTRFMDFVCKNRQQCLFQSMVCDGIIQCRDGSDEDPEFAGCCESGALERLGVGHPGHVPPSSFQVSTEGPDLRFQ